ncbi:hypothetical protein O181_064715 [Austropuccinia psidii MF-1]|uniref:RNA polymerase II-associated protein 3 n=1 Tax=Austropuccinia psidii MF-1 TaxID=1389203 RepID=A0A9Q3EL03_9BASI|nr:hypothetical protein [Austropuccinia psidii MF-1]
MESKLNASPLSSRNKGNMAFQNGNFQLAIENYTLAIKANPADYLLFSNRAMARLKLQQWKLAEKDCTRSLELLPFRNCKALFRRATARKHLHKWTEALQDLQLALEIEPTNQSIQKEFTELQLQDKILHSSGEVTSKAVDIDSSPPTSSTTHSTDPSNSINESDSKKITTQTTSQLATSFQVEKKLENHYNAHTDQIQVEKKLGNHSDAQIDGFLREISTKKLTGQIIKSDQIEKSASSFGLLKEKRQQKQKAFHKLKAPIAQESACNPKADLKLSKNLETRKSYPSSLISSFSEFEMRWGISDNLENRTLVLEALQPKSLPELFGEHLEPNLFEQILETMEYFIKSGESNKVLHVMNILESLDKVPRIQTLIMFLEPIHKQVIDNLFEVIGNYNLVNSSRILSKLKSWQL